MPLPCVCQIDEELLGRTGGAVAQSLRIARGQQQLRGAEEPLVEDLFLIGDELSDTVGHFHRAALELHHRDRDAVQVQHDIRTSLVASLERHFLGQPEIVALRVLPVNQVHRVVRLACRDLHLYAVAQQLVRAQVGLVQRDAGGVGGCLELLQRGGNVRGGVAAGREVVAQECGVDVAIVGSCAPVAEVAVAEVVGVRGVGEEGDHAVLGDAFGARGRGHRYVLAFRSSSSLSVPSAVSVYFCRRLFGLAGMV